MPHRETTRTASKCWRERRDSNPQYDSTPTNQRFIRIFNTYKHD